MKKINTDGAKINLPINKKLRFKNRKKQPTHRLPFVSLGAEMGINYWDVPKTGGYIGGCKTGNALALIYLKHTKENDPDEVGGRLHHIVLDMLNRSGNGLPQEHDSLRGQIVGFFYELEKLLYVASVIYGNTLDKHRDKDLLRKANAGLEFDSEAYLDSLPEEV